MTKVAGSVLLAASVNAKDFFVYVFTGDGKGKTTAALGQALRARGRGWKVLIIQFIKKIPSGEVEPLKKLGIDIFPMGLGFVGVSKDKSSFKKHQKAAQQAFAFAKEKVGGGGYNLLILDEVVVAISLGLLKEGEVRQFLRKRPKGLNVILTGRNASESLIKGADLVTEMREVKHPHKAGYKARPGLEY